MDRRMSFWSIFKRRDPLERHVSMIVKNAVRWEKEHPGRPIHECLGPRMSAMLLRLMPEGSKERLSLESIIDADPPISDIREWCCTAIEVLSGITPDRPDEYARLVELVDRELVRLRGDVS